MQLRWGFQVLTAVVILTAHWALFVLFPGTEGPFSKTDNVGAMIDLAILGKNYPGYYVTINFMSSAGTTLLGVWTAQLLMQRRPHRVNVKLLAAGATMCFVLGWALEPFNPMIKRLWTASFTLASAGWVLLMLLVFYWAVEVQGVRKRSFPLVVVGMNSIFIYLAIDLECLRTGEAAFSQENVDAQLPEAGRRVVLAESGSQAAQALHHPGKIHSGRTGRIDSKLPGVPDLGKGPSRARSGRTDSSAG